MPNLLGIKKEWRLRDKERKKVKGNGRKDSNVEMNYDTNIISNKGCTQMDHSELIKRALGVVLCDDGGEV